MVTDLNKTSTVGTLSHLIDITLHTCTQSVNIQRPLQKKSCFFHLSARRYYSREQGGQGIFVDNLCVMFCGIAHIGKVSISTLDMQISNKLQETPGEETMNHIAVRTELHIQFTKQHHVTYLHVIHYKIYYNLFDFVAMLVQQHFCTSNQSERKGNNKVSKCKLKKYLSGNKTKEKSANFATRWLLLIVLQQRSQLKCKICISPLVG